MTETINIQAEQALPNNAHEVLIHTMPKHYRISEPAAKQAKNIGIIILAVGLLIIAGGLIFLYFYFFKLDSSQNIIDIPPASETYSTNKQEISTEDAGQNNTELREVGTDFKPVLSEFEDMSAATGTDLATMEDMSGEDAASSTSASTTVIAINEETELDIGNVEYIIPLDSDADGLFDIEEVLFGTKASDPDSDADGYDDLAEIKSRYNPNGAGSLMANPNIEKYINSTYNYFVYYPYVWEIEKLGGDESLIFKMDNNQFAQILSETKDKDMTLSDWYQGQTGAAYIKTSQIVYKKGWEGIKNDDGLTYYLSQSQSEHVYILTYNLGNGDTLYYKNIFEMMIDSFDIND